MLFHRDKAQLRLPTLWSFAVTISACLFFLLPHANSETSSPQNDQGGKVLARGAAVSQDIAGGTSQVYSIHLSSGQYLRVLITRGDLNIVVTLCGPDTQQLGGFKSSHYGSLRVSHTADAAGLYHLKVSSLETEDARGRYELVVEELRRATARDRKDDAATRAFYEAERLRAEWVDTSTRSAIRKYAEALAIWQSAARPRQAIEVLACISDAYFTLSDYPQALLYYHHALALSRRAGEHAGEARALNGIGYVYNRTGKEQKALTYFQRVIASYSGDRLAARLPDDRRAEARALCDMGEVYYARGDLRGALKLFQRALTIWTEIGDRAGQAAARLNIGHAYTNSGDPHKASGEFEQALSLWRVTGDRGGEAFALMAVGAGHSFFGRTELARESQRQALHLFRVMGDRHGEAVALNGVARIYEELNELQTALDNYFQALTIFERNNTKEFASVTQYCIGRVYRWMGQTAPALEHYKRSITLSREFANRRIETYALMDVATLHSSTGDTWQALRQYKNTLRLNGEIGDRRGQAKALNSIGDIHYSLGDGRAALNYYRRALPLYEAAKDSSGKASTLYNMGRAARAVGDLEAALSHVESAIKIVELLRVQIASPALRSSYFASVRKHYGLYIDLLMQLHARRPGEGFAAAAFEASENARARVLLETLAESATNFRQSVTPELLERERFLQQLLSTKALYQSRLLGSRDTENESEEVAQEIRQLATEYHEVQAQIREQNPRYAQLTQPRPLRFGEIQQELMDEQTLLLEYALGDERSYLWAISSTSIESFELPKRTTLETAAREVYGTLVARQPSPGETEKDRQARITEADGQYRRSALDLSRMLLGPVAAQLRNKRILIVADGALQYVPFEALPVPLSPQGSTSEAGSSLGDVAPMVLEHEIVNLPSASALIALRRDQVSHPPASGLVAVLADPVFEQDDPRVKTHGAPPANALAASPETASLREALRDGGKSGSASRLPYTRLEAEEILSLIPMGTGIIATGFDANLTTATSPQLSQYQIVHFATHGIANDKHPELSGIILSLVNEQGNPEKGFLQLHDIYNLNLSATLVVLSACDTGLGKDVNGEGLVGITRGFMYAGSKSVLASLWKVDDRATAELMGHFYRAMLKDGLPPAAALRAAKIAMWKQPHWRPPYYWAAFVLQGEYAQGIKVGGAPPNLLGKIRLPIIILALLIGGYFVVRLMRKRSASMR